MLLSGQRLNDFAKRVIAQDHLALVRECWMIEITCTTCRTPLTMDDAFAGGVCRCQHCGAIQTVPSKLKAGARPTSPSQGSLPGSKTLYQRKAHSDAGTGLDDLASAVASSGLSSQHLRTATATASAPKRAGVAPGKKQSPLLFLLLGVVLLIVLIIVVVVLISQHSGSATANNPDTPANPAQPSPGNTPAPTGSSFCGVPIIDGSVVYVLDRGSATERYFDPMKAALYRSLELIGPSRQFAVILSDNGTNAVAYPAKGLANADAGEIQHVRSALDDVIATGSSTLASAVQQAVARNPAVIVVMTAKWTLDADDASVLKQNAQRGIHFDTFILRDTALTDALSDALKDVAGRSDGNFRSLTETELRQFGQ
jgi:hypothetical protein